MKVQSVLECVSKSTGKPYYEVVLEEKGKVIAWEKPKIGDDIPAEKVVPNKNGDGFIIKSEKGSGGYNASYKKNDELIVAQVAFKAMVDLIIADKLNVGVLNSDTCIKLAQIIIKTEVGIKAGNGAAHALPAPSAPAPAAPAAGIHNIGMLRTAISKEYPTLRTVSAQDSVLGDVKHITDFDEAYRKVVEYMETPLMDRPI